MELRVRSGKGSLVHSFRTDGLIRFAILLLALGLLGACQGREPSGSAVEILQVSQESAGANLRTLRADDGIYVTYPDLGSLSLILVRFPVPPPGSSAGAEPLGDGDGETTYLDRISETPEIEKRFGSAPMVRWHGLLNVFYADREREGTPVLKWVSGPSQAGKWWIDILPLEGDPLAVLPAPDGDVELYLAAGGALVRRALQSQSSTVLMETCDPEGDVSVIDTDGVRGITLFDRSSGRLYAVLDQGGRTQVRSLYTDGVVHHSVLHDGRLRVLLYSPRDSTLLLLEQSPGSQVFATTPVTLCEATTSVFLGYRAGRPYFLYTQRGETDDGRARYLISLLHSNGEQGETRYVPRELVRAESPIQRFSVVPVGNRLYVFFVQEGLKMFSLDLDEL
jgi:hypothetical protein